MLLPANVCLTSHFHPITDITTKTIIHHKETHIFPPKIKPKILISTTKPNMKKKKNPTFSSTSSDVLRLIDSLGIQVTPDIYASLLKECTLSRNSSEALKLHSHIIRSRLKPTLSPLLINRLILMHVSCGNLDIACQLFDVMSFKDFNSWATLFIGYADNGLYFEALHLFLRMIYQINLFEFPFPESTWFIVCLLNACSCTMCLEFGKQVHGCLLKLGYTNHMPVNTTLINMYGKLGCLEGVDFAFNQVYHRNSMIWTTKMLGNWREKNFYEIFEDFKQMGREGIKKNSFLFSLVLKACGWIRNDGHCGQQVHANVIKAGLESKMFTQSGLIYMYGKCGLLRDAERVFEIISDKKNCECWNAMVMGYMQHGLYVEAIKLVYQMKAAGLKPHESLLNELGIGFGSTPVGNKFETMGTV